jgi:hypothetical protein
MATTRSPNYPACSLDDAVTMLQNFWRKEQRTAVPADVAAKAIGYKSLSGPARTKLAALKKYGLLLDEKQGMKVSPLALRILNPPDDYDKMLALREAALKPELFKELSQTHMRASDDAIRAHLINTLGFSDTGAGTLIKSFRDTMRFAKLPDLEYDATSEQMKQEATPDTHSAKTGQAPSVHVFTWSLSMPRNVRAELRLFGSELKKEDVTKLKKQIESIEESFDE